MPRTRTSSSGSLSKRDQQTAARARADRVHDRYVQRTYGLLPGEYADLLARQGGRCAVCRRKSSRRLVVEHSHLTGTVRGLLCWQCNRDLVAPLDGDPEKIQSAIEFLERMLDDLLEYRPESVPGTLVETD